MASSNTRPRGREERAVLHPLGDVHQQDHHVVPEDLVLRKSFAFWVEWSHFEARSAHQTVEKCLLGILRGLVQDWPCSNDIFSKYASERSLIPFTLPGHLGPETEGLKMPEGNQAQRALKR